MKKTTQGFLAGAAGLGLLLGGSTFALWTDTEDVPSSRITAGNLEVKVDNANWRDMSSDRTDNRWGKGHEIRNLEKFRIIPGDQIRGEFKVHVGLQGENMVANLRLANLGNHVSGPLAKALKVNYEVRDHRNKKIGDGDWRGVEVQLASADNGNSGPLPTVSAKPDGRAEFTVIVTVEFKDTDDLKLREAHADLLKTELELKQTRSKAYGYKHGGWGPRDAGVEGEVEGDLETDVEVDAEADAEADL